MKHLYKVKVKVYMIVTLKFLDSERKRSIYSQMKSFLKTLTLAI